MGWGNSHIAHSATLLYNSSTRFFYTNNPIDYDVCIMGLNMAIYLGMQQKIVLGYYDLLIRLAQGE